MFFFSFFVVEFERRIGTNVFFADQASSYIVRAKDVWQTLNVAEGVEVILSLMESVHAVLMDGSAWKKVGEFYFNLGGFGLKNLPVRMAARLGEQLLTEAKALLKIKLFFASASRLGVWTILFR